MILLVDNYDSFTYNVYQALLGLGREVKVVRNDTVTVEQVREMDPEAIIISPGPGRPEDSGCSMALIGEFSGHIPILGICLGHQCIGQVFGGTVIPARELFHGKESMIYHDGKGLFAGLRNPFRAIRYHSLALDAAAMPAELEVCAWTYEGEIMAVRHRHFSVEGVQFHPESIGSEFGPQLFANFLDSGRERLNTKTVLTRLFAGETLQRDEAEQVMTEMAEGRSSPVQMAALLSILRQRGATVAELSGFVRVMRRKAVQVKRPEGIKLLDTCGTGGDHSGTFNISTCAALVASGAGVAVAKHGNRSVTSRCGSADVLEALGVNIHAEVGMMEHCLAEKGIAFLFAPAMHASMRHVAPVRAELGVRTVFNILGPLANPAAADYQILGVYEPALLRPMAEVLADLGVQRAMVVHGADGLDEISLTGPTAVCELRDGWIREYTIDPVELGLARCTLEELAGNTLQANAEIALAVLAGEPGPRSDIVLLNAAAAIYLYGLAVSLAEGLELAREAVRSGAAMARLEALVEYSHD